MFLLVGWYATDEAPRIGGETSSQTVDFDSVCPEGYGLC